jgi:hypothetical protein
MLSVYLLILVRFVTDGVYRVNGDYIYRMTVALCVVGLLSEWKVLVTRPL